MPRWHRAEYHFAEREINNFMHYQRISSELEEKAVLAQSREYDREYGAVFVTDRQSFETQLSYY